VYYLDTNTCIYFLKGMYPSILEEFKTRRPEEIKIPSLVKAELLLGVEKSEKKAQLFLEPFEIVGFDDGSALVYAKIRASLESRGRIVGPNDLIIAATVMSRNGILITHNTKEFKQISGLRIEDWAVERKG